MRKDRKRIKHKRDDTQLQEQGSQAHDDTSLQEQEGEGHDDQLRSRARLSPTARKRAQAWSKFKKKDEPLRTEMAIKERWIMQREGAD